MKITIMQTEKVKLSEIRPYDILIDGEGRQTMVDKIQIEPGQKPQIWCKGDKDQPICYRFTSEDAIVERVASQEQSDPALEQFNAPVVSGVRADLAERAVCYLIPVSKLKVGDIIAAGPNREIATKLLKIEPDPEIPEMRLITRESRNGGPPFRSGPWNPEDTMNVFPE